ncbi:MAG: hypothetical protein R2804_13415 [Cyclobacteriaceae bacterium]
MNKFTVGDLVDYNNQKCKVSNVWGNDIVETKNIKTKEKNYAYPEALKKIEFNDYLRATKPPL